VTRDPAPQLTWKRQQWLVLAMWVIVGAWMIRNAIPALTDWTFPDPDDPMRLMQVRDWLAGQSWFDVTQYRLNAPAGGPMHWSRLVDIPIAAVILTARLFLDQHGAETAALIAVPLLTLGITMLLIHRITHKLMGTAAALLAVLATPGSLGAMKQMRIMRIDHHGWQIVMALVAMLAVLDERPRRSGLVAGAAMALWCNISIEALPFVAALGGWFALQWLLDGSAGERLKSYLGGLAAASLLLFGLTHAPSVWLEHPHDALNIAHLAGFAVAAVGSQFAVRHITDLKLRLAALAAVGLAAVTAMFGVDPHFLQGPFSSLDPLVARDWYQGVDEGMPVWRLAPGDAATGLAQPFIGLLGAGLAVVRTQGEQRKAWIAFLYLLGAVTLSALFVIREATTASTISLPGTAFLCELALGRARTLSLAPARIVATVGALFIMAPAYAAPALVMPDNPQLVNAWNQADYCTQRSMIEKLDDLPPSNLAVPLDITPALLASSHHLAIASGYHRNDIGIHDVIVTFAGPLPSAREIIAKRHIDYVVMCRGAVESIRWANRGPEGLASRLNADRPPEWLEPVAIPGLKGLHVWRVRKDIVSAPAA
jgi:asparagine N-glycosylation enzyme membrane subunit Stt3